MAGCLLIVSLNQLSAMAPVFASWHFLLKRLPDLVVRIEAIGRAKPVRMENHAHFVGAKGRDGWPRENVPTMLG